MLSDQYEISVLRYCRDTPAGDGWHRPGDIAKAVDVPLWKVRSVLAELRRRHMLDRGGPGQHFGNVSITERGLVELAAADQLRLVS